MHWFGLSAAAFEARLREAEIVAQRMMRIPRRGPEQELPDADLPDGEHRAAIDREAARRWRRGHH
jgi:hypothetical protein